LAESWLCLCFGRGEKSQRVLWASLDALATEGALLNVEFGDGFLLVPGYRLVFTGIEALAAVDAAIFALLPAGDVAQRLVITMEGNLGAGRHQLYEALRTLGGA